MQKYSSAARILHWITAILVLFIGVLGIWMARFEPADQGLKFFLYDLHENLGITVFFVIIARAVVRWRLPPPGWPEGTPAFTRLAPRLVHLTMYGVLLAQPVLGFLATNAWGFPRVWWWLLPLPSPIGRDARLAPILSALHDNLALALMALIAVHIAGVLVHLLVLRDGAVRRMI